MNYPKIEMTVLWRFASESLHPSVQKEILEEAEAVMDTAYPERLNDEELVWLSYKLPWPLALALVRHRLIRGLALREQARKRS